LADVGQSTVVRSANSQPAGDVKITYLQRGGRTYAGVVIAKARDSDFFDINSMCYKALQAAASDKPDAGAWEHCGWVIKDNRMLVVVRLLSKGDVAEAQAVQIEFHKLLLK
jgi:hypothetical protein